MRFQIAEMPLRSEDFVGLQEKRCYSKVSPFKISEDTLIILMCTGSANLDC